MTARRGHGEGSIYRRPDGLWAAAIALPTTDGRRRRKVITRKNKAALVAEHRRLTAELARTGDLETASPTLEAWMNTWLERVAAPRLKPRTLATYRGYADRYIIPTIGRYRLSKLTVDHVRRLHATMTASGLSSTTALQAHRILAKALTDAVREGKIGRNVATLTDAPARAINTRTALTVDEGRALLGSVAKLDEGAAWAVALMAGVRQGERLGITADMLDLDAGTLTIAWQLQRLTWSHGCTERGKAPRCGKVRAGYCPQRTVRIPPDQEAVRVRGGLWLTRPKSRAGWRQVPLAPPLWEILRRYRATHAPGLHGLVFTDDDGHPIDPTDDNAAWNAALVRADLPPVVLHSARHTANTLLHSLGVDADTRQKIMGHSSAAVNAGYIHMADPIMRDAMDRLGSVLVPELEGPAPTG
jgi:integrase